MTDANRILDIEVFRHPELDRFVSLFEAGLRKAVQAQSSQAWSGTDEMISFLARNDAKKLKQLLRSAAKAVVGQKVPFNRLGDNIVAYARFVMSQGRTPKLEPGYNDVLYHIKTSNEILNPLRVFISDKEFVKVYVKAMVGDEFNVPTIAVLKSEREIDAFDFPAECAIKPTHMSGKYQFPGLGADLDREELKAWLKHNHYLASREANYVHLQPKIMVEELLKGFYEVKFFCLYGKPKLVKAILGGKKNRSVNFFDTDWNELPAEEPEARCPHAIPRPARYNEMIAGAEKLSASFNYIRIDFYTNDKVVLVGEITNCDNAASAILKPEGAHETLSRVIFGSGR